ncbi:hypothetical protein J6590_027277 [Homalodisca vitripennis]|nr:hypothetical protein J6590_027277 [Homalodisca vitripennis]
MDLAEEQHEWNCTSACGSTSQQLFVATPSPSTSIQSQPFSSASPSPTLQSRQSTAPIPGNNETALSQTGYILSSLNDDICYN